MMPETDLLNLPTDVVLARNGLLAIWVTNNRRLLTFVRENLLKKWNIKLVAEWIWLKSTATGQPVCEFQPNFKMPFEILLLGVRANECTILPRDIPKRKYFLSVQCIVPSRKVPLKNILEPFLPENYSTLELFARNLLPDTTSVGYEVLKMQHDICFEDMDS